MYSPDLKNIPLKTYQKLLLKKDLLPGRKMLQENLNENFALLASAGIRNLFDLQKSLSSPDKILSLAEKTGIPKEYLTLLKRESGTLKQKPTLLYNFSGMDDETSGQLEKANIRSSRDYYELYVSSPAGAVQKTGIPADTAERLFSISDLLRINGVGPAAAQTFFEAGFSSVSAVAGAEAEEMLKKVSSVNAVRHYYNAKLGVKDMQFCIDFAKLLLQFSGC